MNVPHLLDFLEASLSGKALDKARRNQGRTDWTGVQTQYSEKWSLFWSVAALKTVVYPFHFISFLTHQPRPARTLSPQQYRAVESSLRVHLDDLASFCITLPFVEFCSLCDQLRLDNQEWSERVEQDPTAKRILGVWIPSIIRHRTLTTPCRAAEQSIMRTISSSWLSIGCRPLSSHTMRPSKSSPANVGPSIDRARTLRLSRQDPHSTMTLFVNFPIPHRFDRRRTSCRLSRCSSARTTNFRHTWRGNHQS